MNIERIPQTDSIQELAGFWDTHDLTDFENQLEEVTEPVFERRIVVRVQLEPEEIEALNEIAKSRGVGPADLIREWVLEKIQSSFVHLAICLCVLAAGLLALPFARPATAEGSGNIVLADDAAAFKSQTLQSVYPLPPHLEGASPRPLPAHIYVQPKARITVSIEMSNNGTSDWLQTNPGSCVLMPRPDDRAWGGGKGLRSNVFPSESHIFNFGASAPETERTGGHIFQWQMRRNPFSDGAPAVLFGELTQPVRVHVDGARPVGTASFPSSIPADQPFTITGTSTVSSTRSAGSASGKGS